MGIVCVRADEGCAPNLAQILNVLDLVKAHSAHAPHTQSPTVRASASLALTHSYPLDTKTRLSRATGLAKQPFVCWQLLL